MLPKAQCQLGCRGIRSAGFEVIGEWSLGEHVELGPVLVVTEAAE